MMNRGQFITLEGGEGVGKTTNLGVVEQALVDAGIDFIKTREPGGTELGEILRDALLADVAHPPTAMAELLLVFAARAQHLEQVILPAVNRGLWVLCDRFTDATFAYQGAGRGLSKDIIRRLEGIVQNGYNPDLTILLDVDPRVGLTRAQQRGALDRLEQEDMTFYDRVRNAYLQRAAADPIRFRVVDASQSLPTIEAALRALIRQFIESVPS
jgi:dTMP kinase